MRPKRLYLFSLLTIDSVETIPVLNASAAFNTDSGKVFKEDVDIVHQYHADPSVIYDKKLNDGNFYGNMLSASW